MSGNPQPELVRSLEAAGCVFDRAEKGDQDVWESRFTGCRFSVYSVILGRHMANTVLK
jgi:hypothetical protein